VRGAIQKVLLIGGLIALFAWVWKQNEASRPTWRLVATFGRGEAYHVDIRGGYILVDTGDSAWLYNADTLADIAHLAIENARLSYDGQYIYGYQFTEPFSEAQREYRPPRLNVIYDIAAENYLMPESTSADLVRVSDDGSYLLGRADDGSVLVWHAPNFAEPLTLPHELANAADTLQWSPSANQLAWYDAQSGLLHVWTAGEPNVDWSLEVGAIRGYHWGVDQTTIVTEAEASAQITVIDALTGVERFRVEPENCTDVDCHYSYVWHPDGAQLAVAVYYGQDIPQQLNIYDATDGTLLRHTQFMTTNLSLPYQPLKYSQDGRLLLINYQQLYDAETLRPTTGVFLQPDLLDQLPSEIADHHGGFSLTNGNFSPNTAWLAVRDMRGTLRIWNTFTGEMQLVVAETAGISWHSNSTTLAVIIPSTQWGEGRRVVQLWDVVSGEMLDEFSYELPIVRLRWDEHRLVTQHQTSQQSVLVHYSEQILDTQTGEFVQTSGDEPCHTVSTRWFLYHNQIWADGQLLVAENVCRDRQNTDCTVRIEVICGSQTGETLLEIQTDQQGASGLTLSPDGQRLGVLDRRGYFMVTLDGVITPLPDFPRWSPDGSRMLLTASADGLGGMIVADSTSANTLLSLPDVRHANWSHGGRWIAAFRYGEGDRQFILDAQTGEATLQVWGNPIFNGIEWGSDEVFLNSRSLFNEYDLNIWRLDQ
jgi:WD40 repeat protein